MEREILYCGKRMDNGEWVYGWYCEHSFGRWHLKSCIIPSEKAVNGCIEHVEIDPATLGQYTGLTDKNGAKIFEGDIIRGMGSKGRTGYFVIRWSTPCCGFNAGEGKRVWPNLNQATINAYEAVGNIHDNPELMERINDTE